MYPVDANIFLRYLTNDDPQKATACRSLLKRAEAREIELTTSEAIISEVVYVLESKKQNGYGLPRGRIRDLLIPLLSIKGLKFSGRVACLRALDLYAETELDYEDTILIAYAEQQESKQLYSYDGGIDVAETVTRVEP
jgi:uncharacterized protein